MGNKIIALLILLSLFSCNQEKEKLILVEPAQKSDDLYNDKIKLLSLEKKINEGDTMAYNEYEMIAGLSGHDKEFLFYSLRMAEEFNYPRAYYKTYQILNGNSSKIKSEHYNKLKIYYLLKAYELGNTDAISDVADIYPDGKIPHSR